MDLYCETAVREATEAGLMPREIDALLEGRPVTALVPPLPAEAVDAYADRATSELFLRYLVDGPELETSAA
jgi:hypothetical protein